MELRNKKEKFFFKITWLRWFLAVISAIALLLNKNMLSVFIFILTALVGFFENFISKKSSSQIRIIIDFFADKLLVNLVAIILTLKGIIPVWATLIILSRDMLTIIIGLYLILNDIRKEFTPTTLGKISYFFQLMAMLKPMINGQVDWYITIPALLLTVASGIYALIKSEFRIIKRKRQADDFRIFSLIKLADIVTLMNAALGIISITFAINNNFLYAALVLIVAVIFDFFDGKIAKILNQQNVFGKELDSLADTVSFGVAPAIFGFSLMQYYPSKQFQMTFGIIAITIFLFCGILRLARYNIMDLKGSFRGMPITWNGLLIPLIYFVDLPIKFYPYVYLVLGILMVSSIRVKRLI